jgi:hypothetical protein
MPPACGAVTVAPMDVTFTKVAAKPNFQAPDQEERRAWPLRLLPRPPPADSGLGLDGA